MGDELVIIGWMASIPFLGVQDSGDRTLRVLSLLPSASEIVCLIGGRDCLVGRSHECDFPDSLDGLPELTAPRTAFTTSKGVDEAVRAATSRGDSLYRLDEAKVQALRPDVIITQDLCSVCSIDLDSVRRVASSMDPQPRVLSLNPRTFEDVLDDIVRIGAAIDLESEAKSVLLKLRDRFFQAADFVNPYVSQPSVAVLEWTDPLFVAGHWTPQLVERAGASHPLNPTTAMAHAGAGAGGQMAHRVGPPSRRIDASDLVAAAPEFLVICPCGLGLEQAAAEAASLAEAPWWKDLPAVGAGRVMIVDGAAMFSRPGPRLVDAYEWLVAWINDRPELNPENFPAWILSA
ncbi:MAG: hypothetical protein RIB32_03635 [Phycisphaerales bacterium]